MKMRNDMSEMMVWIIWGDVLFALVVQAKCPAVLF